MNKVLLCVLDGLGEGPAGPGNAITEANTPFMDQVRKTASWTLLEASGEAVGIPAGNQGGSEVGHLTMGAGRIVLQPLLAINKSIESGEFFKKPELLELMAHAKNTGRLHLLGMISDQGIHADLSHLMALLDMASRHGVESVYIHGITDGRDVPPKSAQGFIQKIQTKTSELGVGKLATLIGRFYAMDRDKNWERTQKTLDLYLKGQGQAVCDPLAAIQEAYDGGLESDYYLEPLILEEGAEIRSEDAVIFFNFRTDRAAQLTQKLVEECGPKMAIFGPYHPDLPVVFPAPVVSHNLAQTIAEASLKQLRVAETEKFAHVTFFFNSQLKDPVLGETRLMIDSKKVANYADAPAMSAPEITEALLPELQKDYAFIALNYANLDLVGHSGNLKSTIQAVETLDECLAKLVPEAREAGYTVLITGDHGNAEEMLYDDGSPKPSHTTNPVPLYVLGAQLKNENHTQASAGLSDLAPSILRQLGLEVPEEMTGVNLLRARS